MPSSSPTSIKGAALEQVTFGFIAKGAVELAPLPSPGFYSRLFVVWKTSGSWRLVIDLSHLIRFVDMSTFSSLSSLRFQSHCLPIQSAVLWPLHGSAGLHQGRGSCFRYPPFSGDPFETVSRRLAIPVCLSGVPPPGSSVCPPTLSRVGGCGHPQISTLVPSQVVQYLGVVIDSTFFRASP